MRIRCCLPFTVVGVLAVVANAETISDADIQAAINKGRSSNAKSLWKEIKKKQQFRINRAGLDPIEKKVLLLSDKDRIMLEAAEAKRQMREISVAEIKRHIPMGVSEILLEANCYNHMYAGSLPKWGPDGGVHLVLKIDGKVVQPQASRAGTADSVSLLPQEHGILSRQGTTVTYTPLYQTAIYERASLRAWFAFPEIPRDVKTMTVVVISGDGKQKEKEIGNPLD